MFFTKLLVNLAKPFGFMYVFWQYKSAPLAKTREITGLIYYAITKRNRILVAYTKNHPRMNIIAQNAPEGIVFARITQNFSSSSFFRALISNVDVIYQDGPHPVSVENNKPRVLEFEHRYFEQSLLADPLVKKIFVMSHFAMPEFEDPENRIEVLYPSFPANYRPSKQSKVPRVVTIFMSGAEAARKGADILFNAFEKVEEKLSGHYQLNLVMAANYKKNTAFYKVSNECMKRTRMAYIKSKTKRNVIFSPIYPPSLVKHFYRKADIYVMPTRYDTPGMSILEAMSFGLPVISTKITSIPELVKHEYNGYLIDTKDYDLLSTEYFEHAVLDLEKYLTTLIEDADLRQEMGRNSLRLMDKSLNFDYKIDRLDDIFKSIVAESTKVTW